MHVLRRLGNKRREKRLSRHIARYIAQQKEHRDATDLKNRRPVPRAVRAATSPQITKVVVNFPVTRKFSPEEFAAAVNNDAIAPSPLDRNLMTVNIGVHCTLVVAPGVQITLDMQRRARFLHIRGGTARFEGGANSTFRVVNGVGQYAPDDIPPDEGDELWTSAGMIRQDGGSLDIVGVTVECSMCEAEGAAGIYSAQGTINMWDAPGNVPAQLVVTDSVATKWAAGGMSIFETELNLYSGTGMVEIARCVSDHHTGGFGMFNGALNLIGYKSKIYVHDCASGMDGQSTYKDPHSGGLMVGDWKTTGTPLINFLGSNSTIDIRRCRAPYASAGNWKGAIITTLDKNIHIVLEGNSTYPYPPLQYENPLCACALRFKLVSQQGDVLKISAKDNECYEFKPNVVCQPLTQTSDSSVNVVLV